MSDGPKRRPISNTRPAVGDELERAAHVVRLARVARDDRRELLLAAARVVRGCDDRRRLPRAAGQVGEEAPELVERVVLVGRLVVHRAGARLGAGAAERLLVGRLAHRRRDDGRSGDEELRAAAHDHREVRERHAHRAEARARPERRRDDGHAREVLDRELEARKRRDVAEAHRLERLDAAAAARAVDEPDQRHAQLVRGLLGPDRASARSRRPPRRRAR